MNAITIIVPVYNVAQFLDRCLESVVNQSFENFEALLVDDGSTDNSADICKRYTQLDSRFHYLHKPNGGLSSARNFGLDRASGKYVAFLDSDDYVEPDFCRKLYETAELQQAEVVNFGYFNVRGNSKEERNSPFFKNQISGKQEFVKLLTQAAKNRILYFAWTNFIRLDFLNRHHLRFNESVLLGEDSVFNLALYMQTERLYALPDALYAYVHNDNSLTQQKFKPDLLKKFESQFRFRMLLHRQFSEISGPVYDADIARNYMENTIFMLFSNIRNSPESVENQLIELYRSDLFQFCIARYKPSGRLNWSMRFKILLFQKRQFKLLSRLISL